MPFTPTTQDVQPTVGGSADTWGGIINARLQEIYDDLQNLATQFNATQTIAAAALPKAGGTMTGPIALGDPTPNTAGTNDAGFRGVPTVSIDADRTFLVTDNGKCVRLTGSTVRNWTVPPSVLPVGAVIVLRNSGSQNANIIRGVGVSIRLPGAATDANRTLVPQGYVTLWQEELNAWVMSGVGGA